ncbi:MAG: branched-chain amino acid aminotransferase [Rhodospirillales bacterium]|nr:branched-chain amino acid aminotransferase [Rhodospirillales bacterium]
MAASGGALTYHAGDWHEGNPALMGPLTHGVWLASTVFDGARAVAGLVPDLDRHCTRVVQSARAMGLDPMLTPGEIEELAWEGIRRFPPAAELYICPMFWAESGFVYPDPASTRFCLSVYELPLPPFAGFSACRSSYRRAARDMAPTDCKASCLYPNIARIGREAKARGFESAVVLDANGNVAEFAFTNLFMVKDGTVHTPAPTGTFLNGITRQRVIALLRQADIGVVERAIGFEELLTADELFATGNYAKVQPCTRLEEIHYPVGPTASLARTLYWDFARRHAG